MEAAALQPGRGRVQQELTRYGQVVSSPLTAALVNRALDAEMSEHLGYDSGERPPPEQGNRRNGRRTKQLRTERGEIAVDVPRDRAGTFEPRLVGKHQRSFDGFDDKSSPSMPEG